MQWKSVMVVEERSVYKQSPVNPGETESNVEAKIKSSLKLLYSPVESFGLGQFAKNIKKSRAGLIWVMEQLTDGRWKPQEVST